VPCISFSVSGSAAKPVVSCDTNYASIQSMASYFRY